MQSSFSVLPQLASSHYITPNRHQLCCPVCLEQLSDQDAVLLSCGHKYDVECFKMLVMSSLGVDSMRPARCCDIFIPLELVAKHLSADVAATYMLKHREHTTRNRVYCANPSCAQFLGPLDVPTSNSPSHTFRCSRSSCQTITCSACRKCIDPYAPKHICQLEKDDETLKALRDAEGWATCPGCDSLIEKQEGCPTIVCRCGTRFCYTCSKPTSQCTCRVRGSSHQISFASFTPQPVPDYPTLQQLHLEHRWRFARLEEQRSGISSRTAELALLHRGKDNASRRMGRGSSGPILSEHTIPPQLPDTPSMTSNSTQPEIRSGDRQHTSHSEQISSMISKSGFGPFAKISAHPFEQLLHRPTSLSSSFSNHYNGVAGIPPQIRSDMWKLAYSSDPGVDFGVSTDG